MSGTRQMRGAPRRTRRAPTTGADQLAVGLGMFSIALGVAELLMPHRVARPLGLAGREGLVAAQGVREIASGIGILATRKPTAWIWGRVAGDALDLGTLALGLAHRDPRRRAGAGLAMVAVAGVTLLDGLCALALSREERAQRRAAMRQFDYSDRRGFPRPLDEMRGAARRDFEVPRDFAIPPALRPWTEETPPAANTGATGRAA